MANETADEIEIRILVRLDDDGKLKFREGGTLTGDTEPEPKPEPKPGLVTWRLCVRVKSKDTYKDWFHAKWCPSGDIPQHYYPIESHTQPVETVQQLPEGQEP